VAARLPKKPGTQKLTPLSSASAHWEENMIADANTLAATPSLPRYAEIDRRLSAAVNAVLAVILSPRKFVPRKCVALSMNFGDIVTLEQAGLTT
jgi:hypothetical protein